MSSDASKLAVAGVVGGVVALAVAGLAGVAGFGIFGRDRAAVSATITLTQIADTCVVRTLPATLVAGKKDFIEWTVSGTCTAYPDPNLFEIQFVGPCQNDGSKVSSLPLPDFFDENTPLRGRKIKRNVKHGTPGCWSYRILYNGTTVEDPELELMQF
jgi:hypothetical protein